MAEGDHEGAVEEADSATFAVPKGSGALKDRLEKADGLQVVPWDKTEFPPELVPIASRGKAEADEESKEVKELLDVVLPDVLMKYIYLAHKEDDPATPFNSKYTAREKLLEVRAQVCELLGTENDQPLPEAEFPTEGPLRLRHALALAGYLIGANYVQTEEYNSGQLYLDHYLRHAAKYPELFPAELMEAYNQLGILWCSREDFQKAEFYLKKGEAFYTEIKEGEDTKKAFLDSMSDQEKDLHADNLMPNDAMNRVEQQATLNGFYLAQVYGHMDRSALSAEYCQGCLKRQLEGGSLNLVDFSTNCVGLYNYYVVSEMYQQAEYCLHAANFVLHKASSGSDKDPTPRSKILEMRALQKEQKQASIEGVDEMVASVAELNKTWGRFYGLILRLGWQHKSGDRPGEYSGGEVTVTYETLPNFSMVSKEAPNNFETALKVFKMAEFALDKALTYYELDGWVTDHLEILNEKASMYTVLANFESDIPRKCKMLKRKINMFEPIINELNPRVYVDTIRNLAHDLAETHAAIAELKAQDDEAGHLKKINELCFKAIRYLNMLFKTFQGPTGKLEVASDWMPMYISGQLALARLHTKFIHYDISQQVQQHEVALQTYRTLVSFLKDRSEVEKYVNELKMCEEMVKLLPLKIQAIMAGKVGIIRPSAGTSM